ncbi:hypothetical protein [Kordiimonas lacus]|uniref:DUF4440 domain-containing protein n=1 Tax=Kordiimonas lacus TaxID=637679 RepID=A0A1G7E810_9PROT|nr:hypothetical protein [Kordiimonas lacus]SDE59844.1 hypothetical protein SAMN04488071_3330 [Kordiimonas lacus]
MTRFFQIVTLALGGILLSGQASSQQAPSDEAALLAMHQEILDAHKNIGLEAWLAKGVDPFVSANRGVISYPTKEARTDMFRGYIGSTDFEYYRDMVPPVVKVSADGTLGWVIVQVEAKGVRAGQVFEFQSAWIELYEKQQGGWANVGNVSNFKE